VSQDQFFVKSEVQVKANFFAGTTFLRGFQARALCLEGDFTPVQHCDFAA
jgi:hypothetical protein